MVRVAYALAVVVAIASPARDAHGATAGPSSFVAVAQQPVPPARDEFVPLKDLPQDEQLPAAPLLIAAYAIMWAVLLAYIFSLWRRLGIVERDLRQLAGRVDASRRT